MEGDSVPTVEGVQVLPGMGSTTQRSFSSAQVQGRPYIAFACDRSAVIATGALQIVQTLPAAAPVSALHFSDSARLLVAAGRAVAVYEPVVSRDRGTVRWELTDALADAVRAAAEPSETAEK